jgi:hypothetical protein
VQGTVNVALKNPLAFVVTVPSVVGVDSIVTVISVSGGNPSLTSRNTGNAP